MTRGMMALGAALLVVSYASADNWPAWRGPQFNGVSPAKNVPTKWSAKDNIAWKFELPGIGGSTPAVWGEHIFLTSGDEGRNAVLCLDRSGKQLWRSFVGQEVAGKHRKGSGSNPSPTTDGKHVYVYFKSGDVACLDFQGKIVWKLNLQQEYGEDTLWWDLGTSPVLVGNLVVVACIHSGPSYLVGIQKETGEIAWKQDRNLDAPDEAAQTYATPVVTEHDGRTILVVLGADHVTAHDPATGEELWRVGGLNPGGERFFRSIASPVVADGIAVAPYARGNTLTAIRLGGSGDVTSSHVVWSKEGIGADVPTPAASGGRVYICGDAGNVTCLDVQTGKVIWEGKVDANRRTQISASPILADGKIFLTREDGVTYVLAEGDEFKLLATNSIDEFVVATPVIVDGQILIRTEEHLVCVGQQ